MLFLCFSPLPVSYTWTGRASLLDPAWTTYNMACFKTVFIGFLTIKTSDMWLTVISHPSRVQPGPWSCPGTEHQRICLILKSRHFCKMHPSITTHQTGMRTGRLWLERKPSAAAPHTGVQPVASIS